MLDERDPVTAQFESVDQYVSSFPEEVRVVLERVRLTIRNAVPDLEEKISYQIPTMTLGGKSVVHFAGWKRHISVYPVPAADADFERELAGYVAGKGTLKFPLDNPIPYDIIEKVVRLLVEQRANR